MSEKELIKKASRHNRTAQASLYQKYKTSWFMICLRYNRNRYDAEDCLQSGLVKIFSKLQQFDAKKGTFKNWSHRIIVNTNIQFLKKQAQLLFSDTMEDYLSEEPPLVDEDYPINSEQLVRLVQQLPAGYRSIFNLYVLEGYSHPEIAEILGISVGTSKSQLAKAKKQLREHLAEVFKSVHG